MNQDQERLWQGDPLRFLQQFSFERAVCLYSYCSFVVTTLIHINGIWEVVWELEWNFHPNIVRLFAVLDSFTTSKDLCVGSFRFTQWIFEKFPKQSLKPIRVWEWRRDFAVNANSIDDAKGPLLILKFFSAILSSLWPLIVKGPSSTTRKLQRQLRTLLFI